VHRLGDLLTDALRSLVGPRRARQAAVLEAWAEVVGELRARHTKTAGIRGNVLVVTTDLPALSHELRLRRDALIEALNRRVGGAAIQDIQVVVRPSGGSDGADDAGRGG
jgi:predicted nucleic acid-binding Zn ribbon protein